MRIGERTNDATLRDSATLAIGHLARRFGDIGEEARTFVTHAADHPESDGYREDLRSQARCRGGRTRITTTAEEEPPMSKTSSQSPRAIRDSTEDPLEHAKGPQNKSDPVNEQAWSLQGTKATSQKDD